MPVSYIDGGIVNNTEDVGMSSSGLEHVLHLLEEQVENKLHSGTQLHIARTFSLPVNHGLL